MIKSAKVAAIAAIVMATAPVAYARPMNAISVAFTTGSGELRASQLIGSTVYDVQNRDIGKVKDVIVNRGGKVTAVVVDVGAFLGVGGKYVALALGDFKTDNDRLTLNRSKEQLQAAQAYQLEPAKR